MSEHIHKEWPFWLLVAGSVSVLLIGLTLLRNILRDKREHEAQVEEQIIEREQRAQNAAARIKKRKQERLDRVKRLPIVLFSTVDGTLQEDSDSTIGSKDNNTDCNEEEAPEESKQECAICLADYEHDDEVVLSNNPSCRHVFHKDCMVKWIMKKDSAACPLCRETFVVDEAVCEAV